MELHPGGPAPPYACPESNTCGLKQVWQGVEGAVEKILFETTFDQVGRRTLADATRKGGSVVYEI